MREEVTGGRKKFMKSLIVRTLEQILFRMVKSRRLRWTRHGTTSDKYKVLVVPRDEKIPLRRPRRRWEDNIKVDLNRNRLSGCGLGSSGSGRVQWQVPVNTVMKLRVPQRVRGMYSSAERLSASQVLCPV
jgi:hypothetical protein